MGWTVAKIAITAYGAYSSKRSGDKADSNQDQANATAAQQLQIAKEQWKTYKDNILPLEIESARMGILAKDLAMSRSEEEQKIYMDYFAPLQRDFAEEAGQDIQANYARVAADAANEVDTAFTREREITDRDLSRRGVRPDAGQAQGRRKDVGLREAGTRAAMINSATRAEELRVEDLNFNRKATALGIGPSGLTPSQGMGVPGVNPSNISNMFARAGTQYQNTANNYANRSADTMRAGINLGQQLFDMGNNNDGDGGGGGMDMGGSDAYNPNNYNMNFQHGGLVEGPPGVDQVPAVVDGNQPARLSSGEMVVPGDVVDKKGTEFFDKLIEKYHEGPSQAPVKPAGLPVPAAQGVQ